MKINLEQAQHLQDFINKASRIFNVPAYVVYSYIRAKAEDNNCTIYEQISLTNKTINKKQSIRLVLQEKLNKYWELLFESCTEEMAKDRY